ncbi:YggS family pyridoxal phosphate-dependent enzyme [Methanolobus sp. WCC5]|uniref:YggS family pyridoxal phosphate-dependent enzyme n=1 Tax=Methanolobus sp. WCC5 TaxID=3125785 RepID=UPI00324CEB53
MTVNENIKKVLKELGKTKLVCVTKTVDPPRINEAIQAGATIIGENRIQEFEDKCDHILPCEKHFIGHLQTNKVRQAVDHFDVIQSVDSAKIAEEIDKRAGDIGKIQDVFLQVNIGEEPQKFGFGVDEIEQAITEISLLGNVRITGLMCIPPYVSPEEARPYFRRMKILFDRIKQDSIQNDNIMQNGNIDLLELSMGMSGDYRIAIEEGATMVRIGSAIFGDREY